MKSKNIKTNESNKIVLEFDNLSTNNPLKINSYDMEQKKGVDFTSTLFKNKPQSDSKKYPSKLSSVKSKKKKPIHRNYIQEVQEQNGNDLDTILPSVPLPDKINTPHAKSGGLVKKIKHLFSKNNSTKINSSDTSSPNLRGKNPSEMSEIELLEHDFQIKKELLQKKQELEEKKRVEEQRATIKQLAEQQQQEKDLTRLRSGDIDQLTKKEMKVMLLGNVSELKLDPFEPEIRLCPRCNSRLKRGKIKNFDFSYVQEIKCKKCDYHLERRVEI